MSYAGRTDLKGAVRALTAALLAVGSWASAGEAAPAGDAARAEQISKALGLRKARVQHLPDNVHGIRLLSDGRLVVVTYGTSWTLPAGGPEREAQNPAVVWVREDVARLKSRQYASDALITMHGRVFFLPGDAPRDRSLLLWFEDGKWLEHRFQPAKPGGKPPAVYSRMEEDPQGRVWLGVGSKAVCVDRENRFHEFSLLPSPEPEAASAALGLARGERGDLLVYAAHLSNTGRWEPEDAYVGETRAWLFPGGDLAKAQPLDLPRTGGSFTALPGNHWISWRYGEPAVLLRLDGQGLKLPGPEEDLRKLLEQLDDNEWARREEATVRLKDRFRSQRKMVEKALEAEKRPEVKARLEKVLEAWNSGEGGPPAPVWLGPLPGGERLINAWPLEVLGSGDRHLTIEGLWLPGQPEPTKDRGAERFKCSLVRVAEDGKLAVVMEDMSKALSAGSSSLFGLLPDGRMLCVPHYERNPLVWDGREFKEVAADDFCLRRLADYFWQRDSAGRFFMMTRGSSKVSHGSWSWLSSGNWLVFDPQGPPLEDEYPRTSWPVVGQGRRDSRDRVWHIRIESDWWKAKQRPTKGKLVRFDRAEPVELGEVDLSDREGKPAQWHPGTPESPAILPVGPDAAVITGPHRCHFYSDGRMEKFDDLPALLAKHRAAVAAGLQAEQKVCRFPAPIAADSAGNLWFRDPDVRSPGLKVLTVDGTALVSKGHSAFNWSGVLAAGPGVVARKWQEWALLTVVDGAVAVAPLDGPAKDEGYESDCSWRLEGGGALLGGRFEMDAAGKLRRLFAADDRSHVLWETADGWRLVSVVPKPEFKFDLRGKCHLVKGDRRFGLAAYPYQIVDGPAGGWPLVAFRHGICRLAPPASGSDATDMLFDELIPTYAYDCATFGASQGGGVRNSREDFVDREGCIWQIGSTWIRRIVPPEAVRKSLRGKQPQ
jgi:hypothetical protein